MSNEGLDAVSTWQEIHAQPAIWRAIEVMNGRDIALCRAWVRERDFSDIIFIGAGTSAYIGDILAAERDGRFHSVPSTTIVANPKAFFKKYENPLIVQFGRSGNSSESIGVMDILDTHAPEASWLHITCNRDGALATRAPVLGEGKTVVLADETHDRGFAMTSSFTTMLLSAGAIFGGDDTGQQFEALAQEGERLINALTKTETARPSRVVVLGSGALKGVASEMALKILELTAGQTVTSPESTLGFRHGPKAVINQDTLVLMLFHPDKYTQQYDIDLANEIRAQYPKSPLVTFGRGADISITGTGDAALDAVLFVLFAQIRACQWSAELGLNVDNPFEGQGNLSRVVSGVTLYPYEAS